MADLMRDTENDRRWTERLKIFAMAGVILVVGGLAASTFLIIGGIAAVGVTSTFVISETTAAIESPKVSEAADEAIAKAESVREALTTGGCVPAIGESLDPERWAERSMAENVADLKEGCLGVAAGAEPLDAKSI